MKVNVSRKRNEEFLEVGKMQILDNEPSRYDRRTKTGVVKEK